jgi:hypothetical protein
MNVPFVLVDDQDVADIMHYMPWKHKRCAQYYDHLAVYFDSSDVEGIGSKIWSFLKKNMRYFEEPDEAQRLSTPKTMLLRGYCDCKGYALFAGGVLDAMNREGAGIPWCYRFVPSKMLGTSIGHVFVVIDPGGDEIWIDPVLDRFDARVIYLVREDRYVKAKQSRVAGLAAVDLSGKGVGLTKDEQTLLDDLNEYTLGVQDAFQQTVQSSAFNTITQSIAQTALTAMVPGSAQAIALQKALSQAVSAKYGPGSLAARLAADETNNLLLAPVALVETLLNPGARTYESDQYYGATYYYYYVLGQTKYNNNPNQVADDQVIAALKWFIDRTGVFISGREHIQALAQGASKYMSYYSVNAYTTTDVSKVNAAVAVAQQYFNFSGAAGSWAATVGVFDPALIQLAAQLGESVEMVSAQVEAGTVSAPTGSSQWWQNIFSNPIAWILGGVAVVALLTTKKKRHA